MNKHEEYSFSRLFLNEYVEFFFILGINDSGNFDEYWDGRDIEVVGYAVIYKDSQSNKQTNFIYLLDEVNVDDDIIIKHTKKFIQQMTVSENLVDQENFKISKTTIHSKVVSKPYQAFMESIVKDDIPGTAFN